MKNWFIKYPLYYLYRLWVFITRQKINIFPYILPEARCGEYLTFTDSKRKYSCRIYRITKKRMILSEAKEATNGK